MKSEEVGSILIGILMLFVVFSLGFVLKGNFNKLGDVFIFSAIVIIVSIFVKKAIAYTLDSSVEHRVWNVYWFGFKANYHFKNEIPFGIILPLLLSVFSLGIFKFPTFLSYESRALKHRAAKRYGFYSFTEMSDWDNGLIGAAGIISLLVVSIVGYIIGYEYLSSMAAYYALFNMIPVSSLDGTQIFFGSRIIWSVLAFICLIFALYAFMLGAF